MRFITSLAITLSRVNTHATTSELGMPIHCCDKTLTSWYICLRSFARKVGLLSTYAGIYDDDMKWPLDDVVHCRIVQDASLAPQLLLLTLD